MAIRPYGNLDLVNTIHIVTIFILFDVFFAVSTFRLNPTRISYFFLTIDNPGFQKSGRMDDPQDRIF